MKYIWFGFAGRLWLGIILSGLWGLARVHEGIILHIHIYNIGIGLSLQDLIRV